MVDEKAKEILRIFCKVRQPDYKPSDNSEYWLSSFIQHAFYNKFHGY